MQTKISAFCERVIESGWLLAVILVPLFFNVYSSRVFEPDKIALLRTIAFLMALAWVIKWSEGKLGAKNTERAGEKGDSGNFLRIPLVFPALLLACVYILATITSVIPRISFWGSYQRMQGTYTTLSYLVIFVLIVLNLRRPEQLQRLQTAIILTSLPIALYALIQHYNLDPLPWAGDVTFRVASNMGNAIFIGAYFIMVVPLTLARIGHLQSATAETLGVRAKAAFGLAFWVALAVILALWAFVGFTGGLAIALAFILVLVLTAAFLRKPMARFLLLGCYGLILVAQLLAIVFSQSRGPQLGLIAGLAFFALFVVYLGKQRALRRILTTLVTGLVVVSVVGLVAINLPHYPFGGIRDVPYVGRLGELLQTDQGTGKVRLLIWQGAAEMLQANPVRTVIGYGPESMFVAYNPFYPPDLAHYERRNASPDRSHNETFDALITTGVLGFFVYMFLFGSIFFYSLQWLGFVRSRLQRVLFLLFMAIGSVSGILVPLLVDGSLRLIGVGLPLGFLASLFLYVAIVALVDAWRKPVEEGNEQPRLGGWHLLLTVALVTGIIAHFVEIHFGIAIVVTRTYFWVYAALIAVLGSRLLPAEQPQALSPATTLMVDGGGGARSKVARGGKVRHGHAVARPVTGAKESDLPAQISALRGQLMAFAMLFAVILATMFWDYTVNATGATNPFTTLMNSLATMAGKRMPDRISLGMAWMFLATLVISMLIAVSELVQHEPEERGAAWWLRACGLFVLLAGGIGGIYGLIHAARLVPGLNVTDFIYEYYLATGFIWVALAALLFYMQPRPRVWAHSVIFIIYPLLLVASLVFMGQININTVRADVQYKQGLKYDQESNWDTAIYFYNQAVQLKPKEDFYYLFLGRALMEKAKLESNQQARDAYFTQAVSSLETAKQLDPLNTDHTANLARLYRTWAEMDQNQATRQQKLERSLAYYEVALRLSPDSAQLLNEWGLVYHIMGDPDNALARYQRSLAVDQEFAQTYLLIGNVYFDRGDWAQAVQYHERVVTLDPTSIQGWSSLAYGYAQLGDMGQAITANLHILNLAPQDYVTLKNLAILYQDSGQLADALSYAERAATVAPEQDKATWQDFMQQLQAALQDKP